MSEESFSSTDYRRAMEALRNGVPNGDAVRVMGCGQPAVEKRFDEQLASVEKHLSEEKQAPGLLVSGGFGSGKSHLLEFLEHRALQENFVCSRVVISKETPLYDPAKLYLAAMESATVPNLRGQAIPEIALKLRPNSPDYEKFYQWAAREASNLSQIFPASLFLHERLNGDPELTERITSFWAGDRLAIAEVRKGLRQIGSATMFQLRTTRAAQLAQERFVFAARLMLGAGYKGWVLLIDEVELIGRYSLLQRAKSYAELARWLGKVKTQQVPGLTTVAAITDDFAAYILDEREDSETIGNQLRTRGTPEMSALAACAETGMRLIQREALRLDPPGEEMLQSTYSRLKEIHAAAYNWSPPDIPSAERSLTRAMRSHIRRWINEWDLKRLYPGTEVTTEEEELRPSYAEDTGIEQLSEPEEQVSD